MQRILLFGDDYGIPDLLEQVPKTSIIALIAAGNRPQYHAPLMACAQHLAAPLLVQPSIKNAPAYQHFLDQLRALQPDSLLCHSYAMLLRAGILACVNGRAFNVHAALLPRNRGPNPIQWALIHGDTTTGVTLHVMDEDFDSGPIIAQQEVPIANDDTRVTLNDRIRVQTRTFLANNIP
ncbi:MAG: methionyl-tRNA formyltransferase, partial [Rickettsiales bacterium]